MINSFGKLFKFTSWGESHGPSIGCVIDAVPAGIKIEAQDIQYFLDQRSPGKKLTSTRTETDQIKILSGIFEGKTTGAPISLIIENVDVKSTDYNEISHMYRPGHADFTYKSKYGIRDFRGGGRASARETAVRVAAGAVARKIISSVKFKSAIVNIGGININRDNWDWKVATNNDFRCPDENIIQQWEKAIIEAQNEGDSLGGIAELHISNVPLGLGEPIYYKLDSAIAAAIMSIGAIKGVEIGDGFALANMKGSEANDQMIMDSSNSPSFLSNHAGGIIGGISTGQDIIIRYVIKPTSSIAKNQKSIDEFGNNVNMSTMGRHDPCIALRAIYVVEAMVACVLADLFLLSKCRAI
jgi:chorismate synthase